MLYWLSGFSDTISGLNIFRYITSRAGGAAIIAIVLVPLLALMIGAALRVGQNGESRRAGFMILSALIPATLLLANPWNPYVWIAAGVTLSFGLIGYLAAGGQSVANGGAKITFCVVVSLAACFALSHFDRSPAANPLGWLAVPAGTLVIVAAGNIVSLADRVHGSAAVPVVIATLGFALIAYVAGNSFFANYLDIRHVPGTGELAVLCGAAIGATLGFLWLNAPAGSTSLGNTASLALGGLLGTVAVATKHEVILALICCLFVFKPAPVES